MGMRKDHNWTLHMMCVFPQKSVCWFFFHCNWCFRPKEMSWIFQSNDVASPSGIVSESPRASESLLGGDALAEHGKGMARHFEAMGCGRGSPCGHRQWGNHLENIQPYITQKNHQGWSMLECKWYITNLETSIWIIVQVDWHYFHGGRRVPRVP